MKANELRLGNYVNVPILEQCPFRIDDFECLTYEFIKVAQKQIINGKEVHPFTWYGGDLQPIPLTEEWLLKFGFKKQLDKSFAKNDFSIFLDKRFKTNLFLQENQEDFKWFSYELKVEYIHQLQNLYFALTCEELKIKEDE
jgi:hypothetical protein